MNSEKAIPSVLVVIVNFCTPQLVIDCVHSLQAERNVGFCFHVTIVDNDSHDESVESLARAIEAQRWSEWVTLVQAGRNGGFSAGNNKAIREALSGEPVFRYFMLLNPDTFVRPGAIQAMLSHMEGYPEVGILGSSLEGPDGVLQAAAHNMPTPLTELDAAAAFGPITRLMGRRVVTPPIRKIAHRCEWVSGASMMVRREVFEQIGLFDEGFFLYFEEVDLCLRAARAGWQVWYLPEARVVHLEGAATGIKAKRARRAAWWYASRRRFFVKHYGVLALVLADALWALGRASLKVRRLLHLGGGDGSEDPLHLTRDLLWGDLKSIVDGQAWRVRAGL